jgi:hypothetical protein
MGCISGKEVQGWWYNPRNGDVSEIGVIENSGIREFRPPGTVANGNDWVLILDDADQGYLPPGCIKK